MSGRPGSETVDSAVAVASAADSSVRPATVFAEGRAANEPGSSVSGLLIADDHSASCQWLERSVREWGYNPICVSDGATALAHLSAEHGPKLAVLDWEMPGLSGPQVCRIVRARAASPYIYLILLTGRDARAHCLSGLASGADDFVSKPFDPGELRLRLRVGQRIVALQQDLISARTELERRANHDALTGALNRGALLQKVEQEAARSYRQQEPFCLVLLDLDHFKRINDEFGHTAGDVVLSETVMRLNRALRPYDSLGRYGGEEFLVLLPGCNLDDGAIVAARLRQMLVEEPIEVGRGKRHHVTASLGVVSSEQFYPTLGMMVDAADSALYRAKRNGRDRVELALPHCGEILAPGPALSFRASLTRPAGSPSLSPNPSISVRPHSTAPAGSLAPSQGPPPNLLETFARRSVEPLTILRSGAGRERKWRAARQLRAASATLRLVAVADACLEVERSLDAEESPGFDAALERLGACFDAVTQGFSPSGKPPAPAEELAAPSSENRRAPPHCSTLKQ